MITNTSQTKELDIVRKLLKESPDVIDILAKKVADIVTTRLRDEPEKLTLSVTEAIKVLGYSRNTIYELIHTGALPLAPFNGRHKMINLVALRKMLENPS